MGTGEYLRIDDISTEIEEFDGKKYAPIDFILKLNARLVELEQKGKELEQHGKTLMDLKYDLDDARTAYKAARAENEELLHKLEKCQQEIRELLSKVEWYKGQIEAYQYCINCRR